MTSNILKSLSLSVFPTTQRTSPEQHRRNKLVSKLIEQRLIAEADRDGREPVILRRRWVTTDNGSKARLEVPKRIKRWWLNDMQGVCLLAIRYGNKIVELEKGKSAIIVEKPDQLVPTIEKIIAAINAGELDGPLSEMGHTLPLRKAKS
jgi:hypothetical protein